MDQNQFKNATKISKHPDMAIMDDNNQVFLIRMPDFVYNDRYKNMKFVAFLD